MMQFAARLIGALVVLLIAGSVLSSCSGRVYEVVGDDMEPSFMDGQIITAIPVPTQSITRGEAVVYQLENGDIHFKRVVGLPGDSVTLVDDTVFVNGSAIDGLQLSAGEPDSAQGLKTLGENEYYIVGDNRSGSYDSRHHGPIPADHILGRVEVTLLNRLTR